MDNLRQQVQRQLPLIWLEIGRRLEEDGSEPSAHDTFERAQDADAVSESRVLLTARPTAAFRRWAYRIVLGKIENTIVEIRASSDSVGNGI